MRPYISTLSLITLLIVFPQVSLATSLDQANTVYAKTLNSYVANGLVNYAGIKSNPANLDQYLSHSSSITKEQFGKWTKDEQLAFLINLYNAQTLKLVAENYPVKSIKDISADSGGPWEQPIVSLFGEKITLNSLEHEIIRPNYPEARVHFALVCAALGCPILINVPYEAQTLEAQLDQQTRVFMTDSSKNSIDKGAKELRLSPIFDWFKGDFIKQSGSVIAFVNLYYSDKATPDYKIEYTNYDWSLNDQAAQIN